MSLPRTDLEKFRVLEGLKEMRGIPSTVLTAYEDGGGDLQFHAGYETDFERDVGSGFRVLRRFYIQGKIVHEEGEEEPIRMR